MSQNILVPLDFSAASEKALDLAIELAEKLDGHLVLMHAFEIPVVGFPDGAYVATAEITSRILNAAQQALDDAVTKHESARVPMTTRLCQADPRDAIVALAKDLPADLIVMGTHGRRGLARAFIGSVAESVVRIATVPVLTVRGPR